MAWLQPKNKTNIIKTRLELRFVSLKNKYNKDTYYFEVMDKEALEPMRDVDENIFKIPFWVNEDGKVMLKVHKRNAGDIDYNSKNTIFHVCVNFKEYQMDKLRGYSAAIVDDNDES